MNCTHYRHLIPRVFAKTTFLPVVFACAVAISFVATAEAREVAVYGGESLHRALITAAPGDDIVLYPGDYRGNRNRWHSFYSNSSGNANAPITLRSYSRDNIQQLYGHTLTGTGYVFHLTGDYWRIKDLQFHTGQVGVLLDSADHNVLDNIAIHNVRHAGLHFRKSSSNNVLRNCHIYNTGRETPGFGEAVYVGTHEGDRLADYSNSNRIGGCLFGPGITAEAVDIKAGTINTIVEHNIMSGADISGETFADSFIDVKGDRIIVRFNHMHWRGNQIMDHGINLLERAHQSSNMYNNEVTMGDGMTFLKIGRGTVHATNNRLNYSGPLSYAFGSGAIDNRLDGNLPAVDRYTGFQHSSGPPQEPGSEACLSLGRNEKVEIDLNRHNCIDVPVGISGHLLQVWASNANTGCDFRGNVVSASSGATWPITSNYAGTSELSGRLMRIIPSNGCQNLLIRWL